MKEPTKTSKQTNRNKAWLKNIVDSGKLLDWTIVAFTRIICILRTKIAVTLKTFSISNLTFIQQEKGDLFLPGICRVIMSKISITVQLLCVTNSSIAINIWC